MLTHKGTQTITTERLTLRRFTPDDAQAMYENWANDERVTHFLSWQPHKSPEHTRQLLEMWCAEYETPATYNWAIEFEGEVIGSIGVVQLSEKNENTDLGYCIGAAFWNKGIMTEAAAAVIDYLFAEVGFNRIGISHAVKNPASGKVALKCGLKFDGIKREYYKIWAGEFVDKADYGILRHEWEAQ